MKVSTEGNSVRFSKEQRLPGDSCKKCGYSRYVHEIVKNVGEYWDWPDLCREFQEKEQPNIRGVNNA